MITFRVYDFLEKAAMHKQRSNHSKSSKKKTGILLNIAAIYNLEIWDMSE